MNFYDAVYKLAEEKRITIQNLGLKLGKGSRYVGGAKSRGSLPKVDNAAMILEALDYKLCVIPKRNVPDDAIIID